MLTSEWGNELPGSPALLRVGTGDGGEAPGRGSGGQAEERRAWDRLWGVSADAASPGSQGPSVPSMPDCRRPRSDWDHVISGGV